MAKSEKIAFILEQVGPGACWRFGAVWALCLVLLSRVVPRV